MILFTSKNYSLYRLYTVVAFVALSFIANAQEYRKHTVQAGETLYSLSKQYNVSKEDLIKLNPDAKDGIAVGDLLIIPSKEAITDAAFIEHEVKPKETLYGLSKRYGVLLADLKRANNLETTLIKTGQILRVQNFDELFNTDTWLVVKGDTLYNISKRTNTTVEQLKALNNLSSSLIKIGQVLRLK